MKSANKSFGILELTIIVTMVSIIFAIIFPRLRSEADFSKRRTNVVQYEMINTQLELYHIENVEWPSTHTKEGWVPVNKFLDPATWQRYFSGSFPEKDMHGTPWVLDTSQTPPVIILEGHLFPEDFTPPPSKVKEDAT